MGSETSPSLRCKLLTEIRIRSARVQLLFFVIIGCGKETNNKKRIKSPFVTIPYKVLLEIRWCHFHEAQNNKTHHVRAYLSDLVFPKVLIWHFWDPYELNRYLGFWTYFLVKIVSRINCRHDKINWLQLFGIFWRVCHLTLIVTLPYTPLIIIIPITRRLKGYTRFVKK